MRSKYMFLFVVIFSTIMIVCASVVQVKIKEEKKNDD